MTNLKIPLRIVLTNRCKGNCYFCHKEGYSRDKDFSLEELEKIFEIANMMGLRKITFTGGEPLLFKKFNDLLKLINNMQLKKQRLGITTSGYNLGFYSEEINEMFHYISCSLVSIKKWNKFTNVYPDALLRILEKLDINKSINSVINEDNFDEIEELITVSKQVSATLTLMVQVPITLNSCNMQLKIINYFQKKGKIISIVNENSQFSGIVNYRGNNIRLRIPIFSRLQDFNICKECPHSKICGEFVCGVRVFPNGIVTPCLNLYQKICIKDDWELGIRRIYDKLG